MNIAVILAAGSSTRLPGKSPKQFLRIGGKPLLFYALHAFAKNHNIDRIVIVTKQEYIARIKTLIAQYHVKKVTDIITGGASRQVSSYRAIEALRPTVSANDIILIHDAARPCVTEGIIEENIQLASQYGAVETAIPVSDTIAISASGKTVDDVPLRSTLFATQTPQSFRYEVIEQAHKNALKNHVEEATDDAQLVRLAGQPVVIAKGNKKLLKITTAEDLLYFKTLLRGQRKHLS